MPYNPNLPLDFDTNPASLEEFLASDAPIDFEGKMLLKTLGVEGAKIEEKKVKRAENNQVKTGPGGQIRMEL